MFINSQRACSVINEFANFLKQNGDKLFEKDTKLCLDTEQILILQHYLLENIKKENSTIIQNTNIAISKELLDLYKSSYLQFIQDFLFKITNLKIVGNKQFNSLIKLNIFGSLTYLEIKNCQINNITGIQNLRSQLEVLICTNSVSKLQDLLHSCGADQSLPLLWPKLYILNISHNYITNLDNSFRLTPLLEVLDLSHNKITDFSGCLRNLPKLKKLDVSFNCLEELPELIESNNQLEHLDISHNNIDKLDSKRLTLMDKLIYIDLSNNLICQYRELNSLRSLLNINQIHIRGNPISYNPLCEILVKEIVILNRNEKMKKNNNTSLNERERRVEKANKQESNKYQTNENLRKGSIITPKPKLQFKSHLNVMRRIDLDHYDEDDDDLANNSGNNMELLASSGSSPVNCDYDSNRLQKELDKIKNSRKLYGAQWLLSSKNLLTIPTADESNATASNKNDKTLIDELKQMIDHNESVLNFNFANETIIDSFAVNKLIDELTSKLCFLSISNKFLIEKDETNTKILSVFELVNIIDGYVDKKELNFRLKFENEKLNTYHFDNEIELNSFVECMAKVLLSNINYDKCNFYLCFFCYSLKKKTTLNQTNNLKCESCGNYLIKDNKIQLHSSSQTEPTKDETKKPIEEKIDVSTVEKESKPSNNEMKQEDTLKSNKVPAFYIVSDKVNTEKEQSNTNQPKNDNKNDSKKNEEIKIEMDGSDYIKHLLKNDQMDKLQIDMMMKESYKFDNNLKLYFLMSVLNNDANSNDDDEKLIATYRVNLLIFNYKPDQILLNCLCVLTSKNIYLFEITDIGLFEQNLDFNKCLRREYLINISLIEIVEISYGQHYLSIQLNDGEMTCKLATFDVYQTQSFLSILQKIINESNTCTSLKQIRKRSQQTDKNLNELMSSVILNFNTNGVEFFTFVYENKPDESYVNGTVKELMVYNEFLILIEENLVYFQTSKDKSQFKLLKMHKIFDIAHLRLFKECNTKLEISIIDESNNLKQYQLVIFVNKEYLLSQLIFKLKAIWEKIFLIDLPINY